MPVYRVCQAERQAPRTASNREKPIVSTTFGSGPCSRICAIKKEEKPVKSETKAREEAVRKESPQPKPFKIDPSLYGEKRR
jgi:hypothetical protein